MSNLAITWPLLGLSLFNAGLLFWLGTMMVLFSAERRSRGFWLILAGMYCGALFFAIHSVILTLEIQRADVPLLEVLWPLGWAAIIVAPLAWYAVILWFSGFSGRRAWQRILALSGVGSFLLLLLFSGQALPSYSQIARLDLQVGWQIGGMPLLLLLYPAYVLLCIGLACGALPSDPAPACRLMGDLARERARPWLRRASLGLLAVGIAITLFLLWLLFNATAGAGLRSDFPTTLPVLLFDLLISAIIAVVNMLLGQAVVAYEVFTGQSLPRREFQHQWRNSLILVAGLATLVSGRLVLAVEPVYSLMALAALSILFHALSSWRSFHHRKQLIAGLRPFLADEQPEEEPSRRAETQFAGICRDLLHCRRALLLPLGVSAPLLEAPLRYPAGAHPLAPALPALPPGRPDEPRIIELAESAYRWGIPLWSQRGLMGMFLLGEKQDQGLYSREEIDIARSGAERIIELLVNEQLTARLADLQRRRLGEARVMDLQTRRKLHDEVLPTLHTSVLHLSAAVHAPDAAALNQAIADLSAMHRQISELIRSAPQYSDATQQDLVAEIRSMLAGEFVGQFDGVTFTSDQEPIAVKPLIHEVLRGALHEGLRNAAIHGRGDEADRQLRMSIAFCSADGLSICLEDDGVGIVAGSRAVGGSRQGLALHSTLMAVIGGSLELRPGAVGGTVLVLRLP
jgi:two-component sensor histidine kinase